MKIEPYTYTYIHNADGNGPATPLYTHNQMLEVIEQCAKVVEDEAKKVEKSPKPHYGFPHLLKLQATEILKLKGELL